MKDIIQSKELLSQQLTLLKQRLESDSDTEWQDITDFRLNCGETDTRDTIRKGGKLINEYLEAGWDITPPNDSTDSPGKKSVSLNADGSFTSDAQLFIDDEEVLQNPERLLKMHNYDPRYFELVSAKNSRWQSPVSNGTKTLYSSKITVRRKKPEASREDIESWFNKLDRTYTKPFVASGTTHDLGGKKLLILPISDLHYALRSSVLETGEEYNCEIAERLYFGVIEDVLARTKQYDFEKIIFLIGGDQANFDNPAYTTTKGTPQDACVGYFDMMERIYTMTVKAVDILADVAQVEVLLVNGNHDKISGIQLANYIAAWNRNNTRVTVDTSPLPRKYVKYGTTLFCFAHDADVKRLPALIADEARQYWSDVNMVEIFLQHIHHEVELKEESHVRIQHLPTISANSAWSVGKGYRSKRQCKSFIFDKELGMTDVLYTPIKK